MEIPIFNDGKNDKFTPSLLFCDEEECERFGLLTVTFKKGGEKDEGTKDNIQPK